MYAAKEKQRFDHHQKTFTETYSEALELLWTSRLCLNLKVA